MSAATHIARDVLDRLDSAMVARDAAALLDVFDPDADVVLVGSEAGEAAFGWDELRAFARRLLARPISFRWEWSRVVAQQRGEVVWFLADGHVVETVGEREERTEYRFSGVVLHAEPPKLALLHGSEPVPPK